MAVRSALSRRAQAVARAWAGSGSLLNLRGIAELGQHFVSYQLREIVSLRYACVKALINMPLWCSTAAGLPAPRVQQKAKKGGRKPTSPKKKKSPSKTGDALQSPTKRKPPSNKMANVLLEGSAQKRRSARQKHNVKYGQLVWASLKEHGYWPAQVNEAFRTMLTFRLFSSLRFPPWHWILVIAEISDILCTETLVRSTTNT